MLLLLCLPVHFFKCSQYLRDYLSIQASIRNFLHQEKMGPSPFAAKLVMWFTVLAAPVCEFYHGRAVCFKTDLEIISVNTVKEKQILIKMKENCFSWESVVFLFFFSAKISTA